MNFEEPTHEVTVYYSCGYVIIPMHIGFYGEGDIDDGIQEMLEGMFLNASSVHFVSVDDIDK